MTERLSDITCTDVNIKTNTRDRNRYTNIMRINDKSFIRCINNNVEISPIHHAKFNGTVDFTGSVVTGLVSGSIYDDTAIRALIALKAPISNPSLLGNVGINSASPLRELDVVGDAAVTGDIFATRFVGDGTALTALGSIDLHSDVDTSTTPPVANQTLIWNGSQWLPGINPTGPIDSHTDVDTTTTAPTVSQFLRWDGTNWIPRDLDSVDEHNDVDTTTTAPINGQSLVWDGTNWVPGINTTMIIDNLQDVDTTTVAPINGDALIWDGVTRVWEPGVAPIGSIDAHTDVDTTTTVPTNGDYLIWDNTVSNWVPSARHWNQGTTAEGTTLRPNIALSVESSLLRIGDNGLVGLDGLGHMGAFINGAIPGGDRALLTFGQAHTQYNCSFVRHNHIGANNATNTLELGVYNGAGFLTVQQTGTIVSGLNIIAPNVASFLVIGDSFTADPNLIGSFCRSTLALGSSVFMRIGRDTSALGTSGTISFLYNPPSSEFVFNMQGMPADLFRILQNGQCISASTVTAGGVVLTFTGQHMNIIDDVKTSTIEDHIGLIVCASNNEYINVNGEPEMGIGAIRIDEALPVLSLSKKSCDKSCFGVICGNGKTEDIHDNSGEIRKVKKTQLGSFISTSEHKEGDNRVVVNSLGEGGIWVSDINGNLESGDYITTSNIPGYGMKQSDDNMKNYTVAKITMDCDFTNPLKPKRIIRQNELDTNGNMVWDSTGEMVETYKTRYVKYDGTVISKDTYDEMKANEYDVSICAFVGCTYHCG